MPGERAREGYVLIDHRESPGVPGALGGQVGAGSFFEAPTRTCRHCRSVTIINPDRVRERSYCRSCDGPILVTTGEHLSFAQKADSIIEAALRGVNVHLGSPAHG